jgi:hypothetical protein
VRSTADAVCGTEHRQLKIGDRPPLPPVMLPLRSAWAGGRDSRQPWRRVSWGASVIRPSAGGKRRGTKVSPASAGLHPTPPDPLRPRSGTRNSRHHQPFHRLRLPVNRKQIRVFRSLLMAKAVDISPGSHRPIAATPDHKGRSIRCAAQHTRKHKNDDQRTLSTRRRRSRRGKRITPG